MRGRTPKPEAVKDAQGNPGRRKVGRDPAAARLNDEALATVPAWLEGEAREIWNRLAPDLASLRLLARPDAMTFARYCRNFARWLSMHAALDDKGETYTVETASGVVHRARPEYMIADRLERQLLAAEDRFGLNPANRQRIFAMRAAGSGAGANAPDLFDDKAKPEPERDVAARPSRPIAGPVGLLN